MSIFIPTVGFEPRFKDPPLNKKRAIATLKEFLAVDETWALFEHGSVIFLPNSLDKTPRELTEQAMKLVKEALPNPQPDPNYTQCQIVRYEDPKTQNLLFWFITGHTDTCATLVLPDQFPPETNDQVIGRFGRACRFRDASENNCKFLCINTHISENIVMSFNMENQEKEIIRQNIRRQLKKDIKSEIKSEIKDLKHELKAEIRKEITISRLTNGESQRKESQIEKVGFQEKEINEVKTNITFKIKNLEYDQKDKPEIQNINHESDIINVNDKKKVPRTSSESKKRKSCIMS